MDLKTRTDAVFSFDVESRSSRESNRSSWSPVQGAWQFEPSYSRIDQLQSQVIQLEDELSAQRGRILGWHNQQWLVEEALVGAKNEGRIVKSQVVAMEFQIATLHKVVTDQSKMIVNLQRKIDAVTTLALLTSMMVCSLIVAWEWTTR